MGALDIALLVTSAIVSYGVRRPVYLGPIDPLKLNALSEGIWVVTVYHLAIEGVASRTQVLVFTVCILLWWAAWWVFGRRWGAAYRRAMTRFWERIAQMPRWAGTRLTILYLAGLTTLLLVTLASGGGGDNRLSVTKLLRPMESITTLLVPIVLFRLLIATTLRSKVLLATVLLMMIVTGGKGSILSLLIPVTGAALIGRMTLRIHTIATLVAIALLGFAASVTINYGVTDPLEIFDVLYTRMSLEGDVYLLALPNDLLGQTSTTSLTSYLFGPLIKVLFLPIHVDTSIGAQIGSLLRNEETANGPNPQWPIVLLAFHRSEISAIWLSLVCFTAVLWMKLRLPAQPSARRWPLWLSIPLNAFILLYPETFFADPSFPMIYLVQALVLAGVLSLVLRPVWNRRTRTAIGADNPAESRRPELSAAKAEAG